MKKVKYIKKGDLYICSEEFTYLSSRYNKAITVRGGFISDGATLAKDISSDAWWVHDVLCSRGVFDDGSTCSIIESNLVLHDILKDEGRWFRCKTWFIGTTIGRYTYELTKNL